ncbi:MAG: trans-2-enoyl-CoA reductase family protein [Candidatus Omnitrophota bacterium]|nr:trans-2-enoyl-CoA reductase family protein [Candidatus Omnitrophota bacterium]MDZ4242765.1 enoyl-ACP reductase FabV [Candidatus Omnitrophota bacterium]
MIVEPKIRGFICTTAHPAGCAKNVKDQIDFIKGKPPVVSGPRRALVIGASNGYGLASRIAAAFGSRAATIGVFFERPAEGKRTATAGWYNSVAFDLAARAEGLYAKSVNGDAFSDEIRRQVIGMVKKDLGPLDCVIYSLASPRRVHPKTQEIFKSTLRPTGGVYTNKSIDFEKNEVTEVSLPAATPQEVEHTVKVMGGEDWRMWIEALDAEKLVAPGAITIAYSYIGPEVTRAVYRNGTIGAAKDHLEATAKQMDAVFRQKGGRALVSVNKALVTQSSSAIPFIPLYFVLLMKVMKAKGVHENCIQQIYRLFADRIYAGRPNSAIPVDEAGRVRIDDWEMRDDVQSEVMALWKDVSTENVSKIADVQGYNEEFLRLFGFGIDGVDYAKDVDVDLPIPS